MKPFRALFFLFAPVLMFGSPQDKHAEDCPREFACVVTAIQGTCLLREAEKVTPVKLTSRNAMGKRLRAGQALQCAIDASLKIKFCASGKRKEVKRLPPEWYIIPNVPASEPEKDILIPAGRERPERRVAVYLRLPSPEELRSEIGRLLRATLPIDRTLLGQVTEAAAPAQVAPSSGGAFMGEYNVMRERWNELRINDQSLGLVNGHVFVMHWDRCQLAVSANTFVLRWERVTPYGGLTVSIRSLDDKVEVWRKTVLDSMSSSPSLEARAALKKFAEKNPGTPLKLSVSNRDTEIRSVVITPLSPDEERSVTTELAEIDEDESFLRQIGRADVFHFHQLYAEEANEYEEALKASPESEDLIFAAMMANCRAGNAIRATELAGQLPADHPYRNVKCLP